MSIIAHPFMEVPGKHLVTVKRKLQKSLRREIGMPVDIILRKDRSRYGLPMPGEFAEAMKQDRAGKKFFYRFPTGRQRTVLYISGQANNPDSRARRAVIILRHLKSNGGKTDDKLLQEMLRAKPR